MNMEIKDIRFVVHCERIPRRQWYYLKFPINDQLINRIKNLPEETRKWNSGMMCWEVKVISLFALIKRYRKSKKIHFDFGNDKSREIFINQIRKIEVTEIEKRKFIAELKVKKEHWIKYKQELETTYVDYSEKLHALLKDGIKLYPHQIVSAMFMNATRSTLISHEMGLGKTLSSILYVEMNGFEKVLIITPNSLKFNYYFEVLKFTNSTAHIVNWKKNTCGIEDAKYVIVNYEFFNPSKKSGRFLTKWKKLGIDVIDAVICDESHRLKNTKANTYKNFKSTFNKKIFRGGNVSKIFLSGTPAPNRAYELYTIMNQISKTDFPTKKYFQEYYCGMIRDDEGYGYVIDTMSQKLEELYHKIAPFTHRKRKSEVLTDLADKTYQRIVLEMTEQEQKTYDEIEAGVANEFVEKPNNNPLTIMIRLRQYLAIIKVKHVIELIQNVLQTGEKVVVVDYFKDSLHDINKILGGITALHTGDVTDLEVRAEIVNKFQDQLSSLKVFLGSIQTCNYGLTLTAASKLFILTLPYSVGEFDQVSDRLHRIGQKAAVNIYILIFPETIDDYVFSAIENKRKEILKVIDNEDYTSKVDESVLKEVIRKIKEKYGKDLQMED